MRLRILIATVAAALVVGLVPAPAGAQVDEQDGTAAISATVASVGYRAVTAAAVTPMTSNFGDSLVTGTYSITVTELTRAGGDPWTVSGSIQGGQLSLTGGGPTDVIPASAMSIANRATDNTAVLPATGVATDLSAGTPSLSAPVLLSEVTQDPQVLYNGATAITGSIRIQPPTGTKTGVYTGTFVVDLVN